MGMFSWKCAVSGMSIANVNVGLNPEQSKCYLVTPDKVYYEPAYQGYGEFGGVDVFGLLGNGNRNKGIKLHDKGKGDFEIKIILKKFYSGQTYNELKVSENCEYQGSSYPRDYQGI
ncbi:MULTISPECIES: hypothetical protein [Paenibacillus]|uniref:Uncharacterized protein n=1 Tax=Paenibacillus borealis TaxID=160799 RepID=A0ABX3HUP1_PAEBO|nr:hypothetical protein [Paenibacillus borealis]OMD53689.1 hypothetical protein BSK56_00650 [Paenibacillus borealis]